MKKLSIIACLFLLFSCDSDEVSNPERIRGEISFFSEFGDQSQTQTATIQVLENGVEIREVSSTDGTFEISDLSNAQYDLIVNAIGYDEMRFYGVEPTSDLQIRLSAVPSHDVSNVSGILSGQALDLDFEVSDFQNASSEVSRRMFVLYVSSNPEISIDNYNEVIQLVVASDDPQITINGNNATVNLKSIRGASLFSEAIVGTNLYLLLLPATENYGGNGFQYTDPESGLDIFTGLGEASESLTVIVE